MEENDRYEDETAERCSVCEELQERIYQLQRSLRERVPFSEEERLRQRLSVFVADQEEHQWEHIYTRRELYEMELHEQLDADRESERQSTRLFDRE